MTEARRRNEEDWQDSFENESVQSLSRSFYDSFAKGHFSGSVAGKVRVKRWAGAGVGLVVVVVDGVAAAAAAADVAAVGVVVVAVFPSPIPSDAIKSLK